MPRRRLRLIKEDPWLEPSEQDVIDRYDRFLARKAELGSSFGSIQACAEGYAYFGINYDEGLNAFTYREWAPGAHALFLTGDFNGWDKYSHALIKNAFGITSTNPSIEMAKHASVD